MIAASHLRSRRVPSAPLGAAHPVNPELAHVRHLPSASAEILSTLGIVAVVVAIGLLIRYFSIGATKATNGNVPLSRLQRSKIDRITSYAISAFALLAVEAVFAVYAAVRDGISPTGDLSDQAIVANYGFAVGIGLSVGATELISRYRDEPFAPLISTPGTLYVLVNGGASALAYYLLFLLAPKMDEPLRVLTAGIAAMTFFRSALFNVRLPGSTNDVPVGPNLVLLVLLKALDRTYDRSRAAPRSEVAKDIVGQLSFDQIKNALPALCFDLMQNLSTEEVASINTQVTSLSQSQEMSDQSKSMSLGLALLNLVGERTLRAAVAALGSSMKGFRKIDDSLNKALALAKPEDVLATLQPTCEALYLSDPSNDRNMLLPRIDLQQDLPVDSQVILLSYRLMNYYGYELVFAAAKLVKPAGRTGA